ncbi:MAG: TraB/GumN family protein [Moorea sp. SIO2B7]|nr:TraB/GumN family protein [Moorena sp. SIO2B7]
MKISSRIFSVTRITVKHFTNLLLIGVVTITSVPSLAGQEKSSANQKSFLWKVESQDNTVYLLGSVHFLKPENYPLPQSMYQAFNESEIVVFETSLAPDASSLNLVIQKAMLPPGETLKTYLSETNYNIVKNESANIGIPLEYFENLKPWFLAMNFVTIGLQKLGFQPQYGVDFHLFNRAGQAGKQILFLETIEEQLDLFENLSKKEQEIFLLQSIQEIETIETSMNILIKTWNSGDVANFEDVILQSFEEFPKYRDIFLTQRNRKWLTEIKLFLNQDQDYLVIVGAAHLVGNDGLIKLLQKEGYSVEQL